MANKDEPHEIEKIIAKRNLADARKLQPLLMRSGRPRNWQPG